MTWVYYIMRTLYQYGFSPVLEGLGVGIITCFSESLNYDLLTVLSQFGGYISQ